MTPFQDQHTGYDSTNMAVAYIMWTVNLTQAFKVILTNSLPTSKYTNQLLKFVQRTIEK